MNTATWYVLEDGSAGDPAEVSPDKDGRLRHKDGRAVAYRPDGITPRSRAVELTSGGKLPFGGKGDHDGDGKAGGSVPVVGKDMEPEEPPAAAPKRGYKTRETKAG